MRLARSRSQDGAAEQRNGSDKHKCRGNDSLLNELAGVSRLRAASCNCSNPHAGSEARNGQDAPDDHQHAGKRRRDVERLKDVHQSDPISVTGFGNPESHRGTAHCHIRHGRPSSRSGQQIDRRRQEPSGRTSQNAVRGWPAVPKSSDVQHSDRILRRSRMRLWIGRQETARGLAAAFVDPVSCPEQQPMRGHGSRHTAFAVGCSRVDCPGASNSSPEVPCSPAITRSGNIRKSL